MKYKYLILGGGIAADQAVRGIRSIDASSPIGIISREPHPCYERPPLSKTLWTGAKEETIWCQTQSENVVFHLEESVIGLDPSNHLITTDHGSYTYEKLLVATGVSPIHLKNDCDGVIYYHDLKDYYRLRELYDRGERFLVVGAGYIGTEIAAALAMNGKRVTMVFRGSAIYQRRVPDDFAFFLNSYFTEKGIQLKPSQTVVAVERDQSLYHVTLSSGEIITVDGVVVGIGCTPNLGFASGLKLNDGVEVNAYLCSSDPDIYAAGDVANIYYPLVQRRLRIEHEDNAHTTGFIAGQNMAGANLQYTHQPYFYSAMFELGYEAVGLMGQDFEMVQQWEDLFRKGTIYYCKDGRVCGAMLWGIWDELDRIREMIKEGVHPPVRAPS